MPWIGPPRFTISTNLAPKKILEVSPLVRATHLTFQYLEEHGAIGLTKSGAMNRKFLHWAAEVFDWPDQGKDELFFLNKVLNEIDFPACGTLHQILRHLKLVRVLKGTLRATKRFQDIGTNPLALFELLTPVYLTQVDHRYGELIGCMDGYTPDETLDIWLREFSELPTVLTESKTGEQLAEIFFEGDERALFYYYLDILRPLTEAGFIRAVSGEKKVANTTGLMFERTALLPVPRAPKHPNLQLVQ
jgi:hypothetical protein